MPTETVWGPIISHRNGCDLNRNDCKDEEQIKSS